MSDRDLKESWKAAGYSMEEMWFFRYNQELIERLREKKATQQATRPKLTLIQGGQSGSSEKEVPKEIPTQAPPLRKAA
ncbi:MAG: hypothetical protein ACK5QT_01580 [Oligoflexia bacterium]